MISINVFLLSLQLIAANTSIQSDSYCYRLTDSPQNHSFCTKTYKYDSIDASFEDFNGDDINVRIKRQFRKTAPSSVINTHYAFEAICQAGTSCNYPALSDSVFLAFQQSVRNNSFYTYVDDDLQPCIPGTICYSPQEVFSVQDNNQTQRSKIKQIKQGLEIYNLMAQGTKTSIDTAQTAQEIFANISAPGNIPAITVMESQGKIIGVCVFNEEKRCENIISVRADSESQHESTLQVENTATGIQMDADFDKWLAEFRPKLSCMNQTVVSTHNGQTVRTTIRVCSIY